MIKGWFSRVFFERFQFQPNKFFFYRRSLAAHQNQSLFNCYSTYLTQETILLSNNCRRQMWVTGYIKSSTNTVKTHVLKGLDDRVHVRARARVQEFINLQVRVRVQKLLDPTGSTVRIPRQLRRVMTFDGFLTLTQTHFIPYDPHHSRRNNKNDGNSIRLSELVVDWYSVW